MLKIDGAFVGEMDGSPDAAALIHTLVELGRILGLVTLAEGIEEPAQLAGLRAERCDRGQGYLVSPPVPAAAFEALLSHHRSGLGPGAVHALRHRVTGQRLTGPPWPLPASSGAGRAG